MIVVLCLRLKLRACYAVIMIDHEGAMKVVNVETAAVYV
jgi:hypothetical protein